MRQGYPNIRAAGAELIVISPDPLDYHRRYGQLLFGEELPWLVVADPDGDIAQRYAAVGSDEHPHGGFWQRTLWIVNRHSVITHRALPWEVSGGEVTPEMVAAFKLLFTWLGAETGEYVSYCSAGSGPRIAVTEWLGVHGNAEQGAAQK